MTSYRRTNEPGGLETEPSTAGASGGRDHGFRRELESLINKYSLENESDTPDFILADFLSGCLTLFDDVVVERDRWHGWRDGDPWHGGPLKKRIRDGIISAH